MDEKIKAYFSLTLAMAIVGSSIVIGKLMVQSIPVFLASGIRFGLASIILIILLYVFEKGIPQLQRKDIFVLFLQSFFGVFLFSICLLYGVQYTTASESGIITSITPMVIGVLAIVLLKEKLSKNVIVGIAFAVCGIMAINLFSGDEAARGTIPWLGNLLVMLAVIGESLFTILGKLLSKRLSPLAISTFVTLFGFFIFLPFAIYEAINFNFYSPTLLDWSYVIYYSVIVTVLGFYLWYYGVSRVSGSISGVFTSVLPVTTLILSYIVIKEVFIWAHLIGILLVIAGIFYSALVKPKPSLEENLVTEIKKEEVIG
jgi:drug/metabolite transporter (DMT)-like permease